MGILRPKDGEVTCLPEFIQPMGRARTRTQVTNSQPKALTHSSTYSLVYSASLQTTYLVAAPRAHAGHWGPTEKSDLSLLSHVLGLIRETGKQTVTTRS